MAGALELQREVSSDLGWCHSEGQGVHASQATQRSARPGPTCSPSAGPARAGATWTSRRAFGFLHAPRLLTPHRARQLRDRDAGVSGQRHPPCPRRADAQGQARGPGHGAWARAGVITRSRAQGPPARPPTTAPDGESSRESASYTQRPADVTASESSSSRFGLAGFRGTFESGALMRQIKTPSTAVV